VILTDLLGRHVTEPSGRGVGIVVDVRFVLTPDPDTDGPRAQLYGFIISPRKHASFVGYERTAGNRPALIARFLAWRHRGTFLVLWEDVARLPGGRIELREGYRRYSARLPRPD
jgi:hypothetical protein